jgi:2-oxoglutarate/2-oxoacid ferredoxin oxidoreductase subunit alpha
VPPFDVEAVRIERGEVYAPTNGEPPNGAYARFAPTTSGVTPRALLGQPGGMHWLTGGEHTASGRVTEDPVVREQMMDWKPSSVSRLMVLRRAWYRSVCSGRFPLPRSSRGWKWPRRWSSSS